jgi:hypothetical protein
MRKFFAAVLGLVGAIIAVVLLYLTIWLIIPIIVFFILWACFASAMGGDD